MKPSAPSGWPRRSAGWSPPADAGDRGTARSAEDETIPVELGGVTRFIQRTRDPLREAHGDYARLHTADGSHLVRVSLTTLEERWAAAGFVRIHRSTLVVARPHVSEVRIDARPLHGACSATSSSRSAAGIPASCATGCCAGRGPASDPSATGPADPAGAGHLARARERPPRRRRRPDRARSTSRPGSARSTWRR